MFALHSRGSPAARAIADRRSGRVFDIRYGQRGTRFFIFIALCTLYPIKDFRVLIFANTVKYWGWRKIISKKVLTVQSSFDKIGSLLYRCREIGRWETFFKF
jgi:hypothetical protein